MIRRSPARIAVVAATVLVLAVPPVWAASSATVPGPLTSAYPLGRRHLCCDRHAAASGPSPTSAAASPPVQSSPVPGRSRTPGAGGGGSELTATLIGAGGLVVLVAMGVQATLRRRRERAAQQAYRLARDRPE